MTRKLQAGRKAPQSGTTRSAILFLHGYGADGADLLGLADPLGPHLPDTVFVAPNAPERCSGNPFGYQWFPIPWLDGSSEQAASEGMAQAARDLDAFIDDTLDAEGLGPDQLGVIGFSQGTMMALHVLPRRAAPVAGLAGFSGRLLAPELLAAEVVSRPPVLLVHGDSDEMVPPSSMPEAAQALRGAGFDVRTHVSEGTGHGIAPDGLGVALQFLRAVLPG